MPSLPYISNGNETELIFPVTSILNQRGDFSLFNSNLSSINFDGSIFSNYEYTTASSVLKGQYFVSSSSANPSTSSVAVNSFLIYDIETVTSSYVGGISSSFIFYTIAAYGEKTAINSTPIPSSSYIWVIKEQWNSKNVGTSGWLITPEGNAIFANVAVRGQIEAESGYIGGSNGWTIQDSELFAGSGTYAVGLSASNISIYAGSETPSAAPFYVTNTGNVYAQNASISGSITADFGNIAGFIIDSNELKRSTSKNKLSAIDPGFETNWQPYYTLSKQTVIGPSSRITPSKLASSNKKYGLNGGGIYIQTTPPTEGYVRLTSDNISEISPSTQYTLSLYIYDPDVIGYALTASYLNSSSTVLGTASVSIVGATSSTTFNRHSLTFTTSSTAALVKYALETYVIETGTDGPFYIYFDGAQLEAGSTATSWDIDSNIRVVSNASDNEDPYRVYITDNTSASTVLLALNPYGILQSRYFRVDYSGGATSISLTSDDHPLQIGAFSASNLRFDSHGIQSIYNYAASSLFINALGGNVILGQTTPAYNSNLQVFGSGSFSKGITASNAYVILNGTTVPLGGSATITSGSSGTSAEIIKTYVRNGTASTILKGQAVYVTGASGTNILVGLAENDTESTSSKTLGLMEADVAPGDRQYVIAEGLLSGLDTSTATEGDAVWLSASPGGLVYGLTNKPYAPNHLVYIGVVTRSNAINGEIFVKPQNGFEYKELHDVQARYPNNYDVVAYDSSDSQWKTREYIPTFVQSSSPTTTADKYLWWDTSGDKLTLWIEDGV